MSSLVHRGRAAIPRAELDGPEEREREAVDGTLPPAEEPERRARTAADVMHTLLRDQLRPGVRGGDDLAAVARTMLGARADAVPVIDRDGRLFGLITLWHFAELAAGGGREGPPSGSTAQPTGGW